MSLFVLTQDKRMEGAAEPFIDPDELKFHLQPKEDALGRPKAIIIPPFRVKTKPTVLFMDILQPKATLVSSKLKAILGRYMPNMPFHSVVLVDQKRGKQAAYWLMEPPFVDCLSAKSERDWDGSIKRMVIDEEKTDTTPILRVKGLPNETIIIHLAVAESLLRRDVTGIKLQKANTIRETVKA